MGPIPRTHRKYFFLVIGLAGALALGFWAGRSASPALLARLRGTPLPAKPIPVWAPLPPAPLRAYESAVTTIHDRVYLFGGFYNAQIQASSAVWMYDHASGKWTRKADLPKPFTHANAVQAGGSVWFVGGFVGDNPGKATDEVWRYDPGADRWSPGPRLPAPRGGGALVEMDGKLHYFGGYLPDRNTNSESHWLLDLADSATGGLTWTPAAPLPKPRGHLSGAAVDGKIYAIGGCDHHDPAPLDVPWVHRYDPATDTWTEVAPLPTPRSHFEPSTLVRNGRIVILGGRSRPTGRESVDDVTEYAPAADRWLALPPLPEPRHSPFAALVGGRILTGLGGSHTSNPDVTTLWLERAPAAWGPGPVPPDSLGEVSAAVIGHRLILLGDAAPWTLVLDLGTGRWDPDDRHAVRPAIGNHHGAEVWNGKLYLFGGIDGGRGNVQIYDSEADTWRLGPAMPWAGGSVSSAVIDSQIYVAGGITPHGTTRDFARFDPVRESWTPLPSMPRGRNHTASATDGKRLYVFGGRGAGSGDHNELANGFDDVQIYDPATGAWTASGTGSSVPLPLPQARGGMGKAVFDGSEFWVFGGETLDGPGATGKGVYDRVDIYDPVSNRWRAGPPMPTARHGIFPVLVGDRIYVVAGGVHSSTSASRIAEVLDLRAPGARPAP
ncbi:MAG TPA: kelch repeat-containing protein [Gemmatimonadales bacterium]